MVGKLFAGAVAAKVLPPEKWMPVKFKVVAYEPFEVTEGFFDRNCRLIDEQITIMYSQVSGVRRIESITWEEPIGFDSKGRISGEESRGNARL